MSANHKIAISHQTRQKKAAQIAAKDNKYQQKKFHSRAGALSKYSGQTWLYAEKFNIRGI